MKVNKKTIDSIQIHDKYSQTYTVYPDQATVKNHVLHIDLYNLDNYWVEVPFLQKAA
jgi:hypothetical protein